MANAPVQPRVATARPVRKRGLVGRFGAYLIDVWRRVALSVAVGLTALLRMFRLHTWRPTVRQEFVRHCWQVGIKALSATVLTAIIVGFGLVFQVILFGRGEFGVAAEAFNLGNLVLLTLVREIAPLLVGLIVIGRSATVMISELVDLRVGGQIHMLEAQGIDTFDYLVVSRTAALTVCTFSLGVIFVFVSLLSGWVMTAMSTEFSYGLVQFLVGATRLLTPAEYLMLPLKTVGIGLLIGTVACVTALRHTAIGMDVRELVPLGFMRAVVATLILSGAITAMVVA
jgi:phospholipid/cholesterol/gamma-HCH transport system permease protein